MLGLQLCVLGLSLSHVLAADLTLTPGAKGNAVVEQVIRLIQEECVFADDRLFLRRLAYVESRDGTNTDTYVTGYHGGIWKVDQDKFDETRTNAALTTLDTEIAAIKTSAKLSNIDWATVTWEDLRKPLYSGLGAWLYLVYKSNHASIPNEISAQATYWMTHYRPGASTDTFENTVSSLETGCSGVGVDLVFVLDASGSISGSEFTQMKAFVEGIVSQFTISPSNTQVGVIQYSSSVTEEFTLKTYTTQSQVINAIKSILKRSGGTATSKALKYLREVALTSGNGARPSIAKVGVVVTDGRSNDNAETIKEAGLCKDAKITMIAIGVGAGVENNELVAIASDPTCQHLFRLGGFSDFAGLASSIEERSCGAPLDLNPIDNGTATPVVLDTSLPPGGSQNCKVQVPQQGATVKIAPTTGRVKYYVAESSYPSQAFYDDMTEAGPGEIGVLYLTGQNTDSLFCNIEGHPTVDSAFNLDVKPGDQDWCRSQPCYNGGTCRDTRVSYACTCTDMYIGARCETRKPQESVPDTAGPLCSLSIFLFILMMAFFILSM